MAYLNTLRAGIQQGSIIQASHVTELYDALSGTGSLGISVIGSSAIGTVTPVAGAMLTVNGEQRLFGNLVFGADDTEYFIRPVTYGGAIRLRGDGNNSADRALQFGYIDNSNVWGSLMTLKEGGFLGIGTTDPTQKLHVSGGSVIADNYYFNNNGVPGAMAQAVFTSPSPNAPTFYGMLVNTSSFTDICYVNGGSTNIVRFAFDGGGSDAVVSGVADIITNHNRDVYVQTQGGAYNSFQLRIKPILSISGSSPTAQTQGTYVLQFKLGVVTGAATGRIFVTAVPLDSSTNILYTVPSGLSYSNIEHTHTCYPGMHISSTDGDDPTTEGMFGVSRRISIGATSSADHLDSRSWNLWVKGKANENLMLITGSTDGNRRFHIDPKGQVGIGTAPYVADGFHTLTVGANEPGSVGLIKIRSQYNSGNGAEIYQNPFNGTVGLNLNSTTGSLYITTGSAGRGRLGIGIVEPTELLHVAGNVKVDGTLTANNIFSAQSQSLTGDIIFGSATEAGSPNSNTIRGISAGGAIRLVRDSDTAGNINTPLTDLRSLQLGISDNFGGFNPVMTITNENDIPVHINKQMVIGSALNTSSIHTLTVTGSSGAGTVQATEYFFHPPVSKGGSVGPALASTARKVEFNAFVTSSEYRDICYIEGGPLASAVKFAFNIYTAEVGGGSAVMGTTAEIIVNHDADIYVQSQAGIYTTLQLKIKPIRYLGDSPGPTRSYGTYVLQAKPNSADKLHSLQVFAYPQHGEDIYPSGSFTEAVVAPDGFYTEFIHECNPGMTITGISAEPGSPFKEFHGNIQTNGRIGIGTTGPEGGYTNPPQAKLHIYGTGSTDLMLMSSSLAGNTPIVVNATGSVGIGTTTPNAKLDVRGGYSLGTPGGVLFRNYNNTGTNLDMTGLTGGWVGVHKITTADTAGNVYFGAYGGSSPSPALARSYWTVGNSIGSQEAGYELTTGIHLLKNGYVGIGTVSPSAQLELSLDSAKKPSGGTWDTTSDIRLKENIEEANYDTCYDVIKNLPLKRYTWKDTVYTTQQVADRSKLGWIAQDVQLVFPKAVTSSSFTGSGDFRLDDCLSMNADQIYAAMYGTVKKLIVENESLKLQVSASNSEIQAIKTHLGL
jgi:hypothetical protein